MEELMPLVYEQLHRIAQGAMRTERPGHTMQATALVSEAWLRLAGQGHGDYQNRAHFFGVAARLMRQILVDHARAANSAKRDVRQKVQLGEQFEVGAPPETDAAILSLHVALDRMGEANGERARMVEMRYFSGMNLEEIATVTGVSVATVHRELRVAQAWLRREMA